MPDIEARLAASQDEIARLTRELSAVTTTRDIFARLWLRAGAERDETAAINLSLSAIADTIDRCFSDNETGISRLLVNGEWHDGPAAAECERIVKAIRDLIRIRAGKLPPGKPDRRDGLEVANTITRMALLLGEACEIIEGEALGLRDSVSIRGVFSPGPEDRTTVDAIAEMDRWISRAKAEISSHPGF